MMNFTSNHCGVSISFYFKACYPVSVYVAAFKVTHAMIKCEYTNVTSMMNMIPSNNWVSMIFNPNPS